MIVRVVGVKSTDHAESYPMSVLPSCFERDRHKKKKPAKYNKRYDIFKSILWLTHYSYGMIINHQLSYLYLEIQFVYETRLGIRWWEKFQYTRRYV